MMTSFMADLLRLVFFIAFIIFAIYFFVYRMFIKGDWL